MAPSQPAAQYHPLPEKTMQRSPYQQHHPPAFSPEPPAGSSVLRVKRITAIGVLGALVVLFLLVIGLSAGLGVSQRNLGQTKSDLQIAQAAMAAATAGAVTTVYATPTSSSTPKPTVNSDVQCPRINGTLYIPGGNSTTNSTTTNSTSNSTTGGTPRKQFRLLCGFDYGQGEAKDLKGVKVKNLNACADACAATANCTGAGWGVISGDAGPEHTCWLKTNLTKPHVATGSWGFAVLLDGNGTAITVGGGGDDAE